MNVAREVNVAVEGSSDEPVVRRILQDHGLTIASVFVQRGKDPLDSRIRGYNAAAKFSQWFVLRDLDRDAECAAAFVRTKLPRPNDGMLLRIAVRSVEAWLLADKDGVSRFFKVRPHDIPDDPESLPHPKRALVDLSRRSRSREIRTEMAPATGTTAQVGPGFVGQIMKFAESSWSWKRAMSHSDSLRRCVARVASMR